MAADPATDSVAGGIDLLERAIGYALGTLHLVTPEAMDNPTPCTEWTLHQLLAHLNDSLQALTDALAVGYVSAEPLPGQTCPVAVLQSEASRLLGALSATRGPQAVSIAGCPLSVTVVAGAGALELAVHGWDVARACGARRPIPARLAAELLELAPLLVTDAERPGRFAPAVPLPAGFPPADRLLAFLGRTP